MPVDEQDIPAHRAQPLPKVYQPELPRGIRVHGALPVAEDFHRLGENLAPEHVFMVLGDAVAHDVDLVSVDGENPVHHVPAAVRRADVEKDDVIGLQVIPGLLQNHEVLGAADERKHAETLDGNGHPTALLQHLQHVREEQIVVNHHLFHIRAKLRKIYYFCDMMKTAMEMDIQFLPGVGPRRAALLRSELAVETVGDLVHLYPFRYIDRSTVQKIADLHP
ncbi:MAG: hypothetical protein IKP01_03150, partial [Bacteroidales bacterium]|nr:hypothetical protein [Bacteroidales bacterium]